ncbi:MAG: NAD(P)-dependent oxidoreductase [Deltaproteobacteria bacterium]|jgi:nucleoside-diphosphate-sugar epimerase|nr:NAD(P)-dependent oxidoreductase [Deltaproteobacteria bacterium]
MPNFKGPRTAIIGGAGYIGQVMAQKLLSENLEVRVVDSFLHGSQDLSLLQKYPGFSFVQGDLKDHDQMSEILSGYEAIILLASLVGEKACDKDPEETLIVNYLSPLTLLKILLKQAYPIRFLFASTDSCYGNRPGEILDELSPLKPESLYAFYKAELEKALLFTPKKSLVSPIILRLGTVYGLAPRTRFDLAVNFITRDATLKKTARIFSGEQWRPLVHVQDVASAFSLALQAPLDMVSHQIFNVGTNSQNIKFSALRELIQGICHEEIQLLPGDPDLRDYYVDFTKIQKILGFQAEISLAFGITELYEALLTQKIADPYHPKYLNT